MAAELAHAALVNVSLDLHCLLVTRTIFHRTLGLDELEAGEESGEVN